MKFKSLIAIAAMTAAALVATASGGRADIRYLVNAAFDDGATLSGDFTLNVYDYVVYSSLDLTTTSGSIPGYAYTGATTYGDGCAGFCVAFGRTLPYAYYGELQLTFANPLGSYGPDPIVAGEGGPSWENYAWGASTRYIASGVAIGVPEPGTWAMMLLGFAGLGFAGYRRAWSRARALAAA